MYRIVTNWLRTRREQAEFDRFLRDASPVLRAELRAMSCR